MKRLLSILLCACLCALLCGCVDRDFDSSTQVYVITREDGSGTRASFVELAGLVVTDQNGNKTDTTTVEAAVTNSTSVVIIGVANNEYAVGYISLGSLSDMVKAVSIDGVYPSAAAIKSREYKICRGFNLVYNGALTASAQDFMNFILSAQGQSVVEANGYVAAAGGYDYTPFVGSFETVVVSGSSSVTPVMEKLKEAYAALNPNARVDVQQSDSATGILSAREGLCDIAMVSRSLSDEELENGLLAVVMALDGIVVIVSPDNPIDSFTSQQLKLIYTSDFVTWAQLLEQGDGNE